MVTDYIIDYIDSGNIAFKVYAYPKFESKRKGSIDRSKQSAAAKIVSPKNQPPVKQSPKQAQAPAQPKAVQSVAPKQNTETVTVTTQQVEKSGGKGSSCCSIF